MAARGTIADPEQREHRGHPRNQSLGAIECVVVAPDGTVYPGSVNGGVWKSDDVNEDQVYANLGTDFVVPDFWIPLTDQEPSLAVASMALDPLDPTDNTLWVGTGSVSSVSAGYYGDGGPPVGILLTRNGGQSWVDLGAADFHSPILSILPTGTIDPTTDQEVIPVGTATQGLWRSTDDGATFQQVTEFVGGDVQATSAPVSSIAADPTDPDRSYAALSGITTPRNFTGNTTTGSSTILNPSLAPGSWRLGIGVSVTGPGMPSGTTITAFDGTSITLSNAATATNKGATFKEPPVFTAGVYESVIDGAVWFEIDGGIPQITESPYLALTDSLNSDGNTNLFVVTTSNQGLTGALKAEISSSPFDVNWVSLGAPASQEPATLYHLVTTADPTDPNPIIVGGMEQDLFRVDADTLPASWDHLSGGSLGNPHDDQRGLAFLNDGTTLLDTDDGGIYALLVAQQVSAAAGDPYHWVSLNENIQNTEFFRPPTTPSSASLSAVLKTMGHPSADFQSVTIGGSLDSTGLIAAPSGGTLSVGGDLSGEVVIAGALDTLSVGGTLDGTVSAGTIGSQTLGGPVTGQVETGLATAPPVKIGPGDTAGLIQAIDQANSIGVPSIINLSPGVTYLLTAADNGTNGPNGLPAILSNITINGNGAVIEAGGLTPFRILYVSSGADLVMADVTIEQGDSTAGGGVYNDGTLVLSNDMFTGNSATGNGGAVYNSGTLTQTGTIFSDNSAGGAGPNVFNAIAPIPRSSGRRLTSRST
jgi:hypothetical protein